jgi:hypothetical protein
LLEFFRPCNHIRSDGRGSANAATTLRQTESELQNVLIKN